MSKDCRIDLTMSGDSTDISTECLVQPRKSKMRLRGAARLASAHQWASESEPKVAKPSTSEDTTGSYHSRAKPRGKGR
jgi:hypothetical protein